MTDLFTPQHLIELVAHQGSPCVSVFLPAHPAALDPRADQLRLTALLDAAERDLTATGSAPGDVRAILEPGRDLLADSTFWSRRPVGLALFMTPGWSRRHRLAAEVPELVVVGERPHVQPLLPLLSGDEAFYLLTLSIADVHLWQGTRRQLTPVEVPDLPHGLKDALRYDDLQKERGLHIATRGGPGATAVSHGQGIGDEVDKVLLERYLQAVDAALAPVLAGGSAPLVLAGVGYVTDRFRLLTHYPHVLAEAIDGNPDRSAVAELHEQARALVEPVLARAATRAAERYLGAAGTGSTAANVEDVVPAAIEGRVDTLFVPVTSPPGLARWGSVDPQTHRVAAHADRRAGDEELVDLAVARTLLASGQVYAVTLEEVPGPGPLAATLRG